MYIYINICKIKIEMGILFSLVCPTLLRQKNYKS